MDEVQKRELIDRYIAAYNHFDVDGMMDVVTGDVTFESVSDGQVTEASSGLDGLRELAGQSATMFTERQRTVTDVRYEGDRAIATVAFRGTLAADMPGGPTAGQTVELTGQTEFTFADGLISGIVDRS